MRNNSSAICTSGFTVLVGGGFKMLMAQHCNGTGASWFSPGNGSGFGTAATPAPFPQYDMNLLQGAQYGAYVYVGDSTGTGLAVGGATNPVVGNTYCASGQTTAETCNHTISSLSATFCDSSGCTPNLIAASGGASVAGGDSGAPFYIKLGSPLRVQIRGMLIANSGSTMYAHQWATITNYYGAAIITS